MTTKELSIKCDEYARKEIERYGLPTIRHYELSMSAGIKLASSLGADVELVKSGISLMDIKLGQCAKEGCQAQHVEASFDYAKELLSEWNVDEETKEILLNCVSAHHAKIPYKTLEAEIVANADCYRFLHPRGVMSFHATVVKRGNEHDAALAAVKAKLEEKKNILSLDIAKKDLQKYYDMFEEILTVGLD